jgi:DNA repair protein RecO (recombination protein O)
MEWRDEGVVIAVRRHGETGAIAELLTSAHGRSMGLVRGGRSRVQRPVLQPGNLVSAVWRARLEDHLGVYQLEPIALKAGTFIDDRFKLAGLSTLASLSQLLPEREPHPRIYEALKLVIDTLGDDMVWPSMLVRWEIGLLEELGFGLDLSKCAATGLSNDLAYVSPKTGRAISRCAGEPYRHKLFALPSFLNGGIASMPSEIADGLRMTGFFLARHLFEPRGIAAPEQRQWIIERLAQTPH